MKGLGLLAYASKTGLGYQTKMIYDNLKPEHVLLVDLSPYNKMPVFYDWYPDADIYRGIPDNGAVDNFVDKCISIIVCETPLNYRLFERAREKGVKVLHQINPEFLDYYKHPNWARASIVANPTSYMFNDVEKYVDNQMELALPIELKGKKEINKVEVIGHIIGRPTFQDRNGTLEFLEAVKVLGDRYRYKIFYQEPKDERASEYFRDVKKEIVNVASMNIGLEVIKDVENNEEIYRDLDLLVLPRKYGGLCIPMLEALSYGIPVIMTNVNPNYNQLPSEWLCSASLVGSFCFHMPVNVYKADIDSLIVKIMEADSRIREYNELAYNRARRQSWEVLKPLYEEILK